MSVAGDQPDQELRFQVEVVLVVGGEVAVDPVTGEGPLKLVRPRPLLVRANALHLNRLKGAWTSTADLGARALLDLAEGGLFMLEGRAGRGPWPVALDARVPPCFVLLSEVRPSGD